MSLFGARRPRIPSAFMPPDWSQKAWSSASRTPTVHSPLISSPLPPPSEPLHTPSSPSPSYGDTQSPTRSTVALSSDVLAPRPPTLTSERKGDREAARSLRSTLRELKERQAAIRRAKAAVNNPETSETFLNTLHCVPIPESRATSSSPSSVRSTLAPPSEIFTAPASPPALSSKSEADSLRSVRSTLRGLKGRQLVLRREREQQRQAAEEASRMLSDQHEAEMLKICKLEETVYERRWEKIWERAEARRGDEERTSRVLLQFCQVPWPVLVPIVNSPVEITTRGVEQFLLSPFRKPHLSAREKIEEEMRQWENEAFEERVVGLVQEKYKGDVRDGRSRVRAALKELLMRAA